MAEARSATTDNPAPWERHPTAFGRLAITEEMAGDLLQATEAYLAVLRKMHRETPNPSPESMALLNRVRRFQRIRKRLEGLRAEKGWS